MLKVLGISLLVIAVSLFVGLMVGFWLELRRRSKARTELEHERILRYLDGIDRPGSQSHGPFWRAEQSPSVRETRH